MHPPFRIMGEMRLNVLIFYSIPVIVWIVWKKKSAARTFPLIVGMIAYMFISVMRGMARIFVLNDGTRQHVWLFYLLSALLSGVFEEVGRYVVFRWCIPNHDRWTDCVSYAIGHGAIELILTHNPLEDTFYDSFIAVFVYADAILFSVSMSVLVFSVVHHTDRKLLLWLAIGLHAVIDIIPALYHTGVVDFEAYEALSVLYLVGNCYLAYRVFRYFQPKELPDLPEDAY